MEYLQEVVLRWPRIQRALFRSSMMKGEYLNLYYISLFIIFEKSNKHFNDLKITILKIYLKNLNNLPTFLFCLHLCILPVGSKPEIIAL